jgi:hypothetical protein
MIRVARKPKTPISDLVPPRPKPSPVVMPDPPMQPKPPPDVQHAAAPDVPAPHSDIVGLYAASALGEGSDDRSTTQKYIDWVNNGGGRRTCGTTINEENI